MNAQLSVACDKEVKELVQSLICLDKVYTSTCCSMPGGIYKEEKEEHRLGDYFEKIEIVETNDPIRLNILFQTKPKAKKHWKDLIIHVALAIRDFAKVYYVCKSDLGEFEIW